MQIKETTKNATIILDKDEDFSSKSIDETMKKIAAYKKLPFHDVFLTMDSKNFVKFWEAVKNTKMDFKEAETKNNTFLVKF